MCVRHEQTTAKSGPPVLLFWSTGTYANLNSYRELSGRPFFPLEIMDGSDFQENKPQQCKTGIKNEVKTFHFGNHIRTWTVIFKKRSSPCFPISVRPAASTVFPNLALHVKSWPTPAVYYICQSHVVFCTTSCSLSLNLVVYEIV